MKNEAIRACCLLPLLLLLQTAKESFEANGATQIRPVEIFSDHLLPESQTIGHEFATVGRVVLLDTMVGPMSSLALATSFSLFSGERIVRDIKFRVNFMKKSPHFNLTRMRQADFQPQRRTLVLIPGYLSGDEPPWVKNATQELIKLFEGQINVIQVSWADSNRGPYSQAVANTKLVARQIVIFFHYLAELSGFKLFDNHDEAANTFLDNLHFVGHSLGAHISGFVGQELSGRVGRITGLDPAGPSFNKFARLDRLDRRQAKLVEVLHTNRGRIHYMKLVAKAAGRFFRKLLSSIHKPEGGFLGSTAAFGIDHQLGHIDLYANDGRFQPGCPRYTRHHKRAAEIYVDVLRRDVALKESAGTGAPLTRLLAFKAPTYGSFQWGSNLFAECPSVLQLKTHLNQTEISQALPKCAIPLLDFVTPTLQLVREYKDRFGINFEPLARPEEQPRYYFATTAGLFAMNERASTSEEPDLYAQNRLVGDHYQTIIYLNGNSTWSQVLSYGGDLLSACSLHLKLTMQDTKKSISIDLEQMPPSFSNGKLVLAVPFIHPAGVGASQGLEHLQGSLKMGNSNSDQFASLFRLHYPKQIRLSLTKSGHVSSDRFACSLSIKNIEVQPLRLDTPPRDQYKNLAALYGKPSPGTDLSVPVLTVSQLVAQPSNSFDLRIDSAQEDLSHGECTVMLVAALTAD